MSPKRRASLFGEPAEHREDTWETVSGVNERARRSLETAFSQVRVTGEISNLTQAYSGHFYFTLKDEGAQLSVVMWAGTARRLGFQPTDGMAVNATGNLSVYTPRGQYQMVAQSLVLAGEGTLEQSFLKLRKHYEDLGWFDPDLKKELPFFPATIGVVTSVRGAAIHDFLRTVRSLNPRASVLVVPVPVQGADAASEIAEGIRRLDQDGLCDVLVVTRGGGSLEDLWAFNEAPVVEAIHAAVTPVVSGVGHEIDVTLADLVADVRALTPTDAGSLVAPDLVDLEESIARQRTVLVRSIGHRLDECRMKLTALNRSWALREPTHLVGRAQQNLDELARRLPVSLGNRMQLVRDQLQRHAVDSRRFMDHRLRLVKSELGTLLGSLEGLSPLGVLERGYSVTLDAQTEGLITDPGDAGGEIITIVSGGRLKSVVTERTPGGHKGE